MRINVTEESFYKIFQITVNKDDIRNFSQLYHKSTAGLQQSLIQMVQWLYRSAVYQ